MRVERFRVSDALDHRLHIHGSPWGGGCSCSSSHSKQVSMLWHHLLLPTCVTALYYCPASTCRLLPLEPSPPLLFTHTCWLLAYA
jgi:hypothetical protein